MSDGKRWTIQDRAGMTTSNNYVATAFFKHIRLKGRLV